MAWRIEFDRIAERELKKLDAGAARRILDFLQKRLAGAENPRSLGAALQGSELGNFWKYRVGDYRIIADIQDARIRIVVLRVGNRKEVYRKR